MKKKTNLSSKVADIFLWLSLPSNIYLIYLAVTRVKVSGNSDSIVILAIILSIPMYIVVIAYCLHGFDILGIITSNVVTAPQTTVEGILDEKTRSMLDKDKDGRILISEYYPLSEEEVLQKILSVDSQFSKEDFYAWVKHLYSVILEALDKRNPVMLRRYESDYLYQRHVALFEDIAKSGAVISNYAIKGVLLKDFKIEGDKEILVVALSASINKVNIYDDSYKSYILTFARKKGVKTTGTLLAKETNCPNCGAVLDLDSHGVCSYCHTLVSNGDFGWILIDMKSIKLVGD